MNAGAGGVRSLICDFYKELNTLEFRNIHFSALLS